MENKPSLEAKLEDYYSQPAPTPAFAARLRAELVNRAAEQPAPRGAWFWSRIGAAGRVGFSLAGAALMVALVLLGASVLQAHLGPAGTPGAGHPGGIPPAKLPGATGTSTPTATATTVAMVTPNYRPPRLAPAACQTLVTPEPSNAAYRRPGKLIAGGVVSSGDFQINLFLFCDSTLKPDSQNYSEIAGLGLYASYWYGGADLTGVITVFEGVEPFVRQSGGTGSMTKGAGMSEMNGFRVDPSVYPDWSAPDIPLRYVYQIRDQRGRYSGAALSFHLVQSPDGLLVQGAKITPLESAALAAAATPNATATLPFRTVDPASLHVLLNELKGLRDHFIANLYAGPGWVHYRAHWSMANGSQLPSQNQLTIPREYDSDQWFLVGKNGLPVIEGVARNIDASGRVFQTSVLKDGAWHDLNTGSVSSASTQEPMPFDDGFYASASRTVVNGGILVKDTPDSSDPTRGTRYTITLQDWKAEATFDPQTGELRSVTYYLEGGKTRVSTNTTVVIERVNEPPAEILRYLAQH